MPELPEARRARMIAEYGITEQDAHTLTATAPSPTSSKPPPRRKKSAPRRQPRAERAHHAPESRRPRARSVARFNVRIALAADLAEDGKLSSKQLKQLFDLCFERNEDFATVYEREKPQQISDASTLEKMIDDVIAANPAQVEQYRKARRPSPPSSSARS